MHRVTIWKRILQSRSHGCLISCYVCLLLLPYDVAVSVLLLFVEVCVRDIVNVCAVYEFWV